MLSFRHRSLSLLLALSGFVSCASAASNTVPDDANRAVAELNGIVILTKESRSQFIERVTPQYRRLAATELMAQMLVGDEWQSMQPSQRKELTQLYEKVVLGALYGAYSATSATQPLIHGGMLYRSKSGVMKRRCDLLRKVDCIFYASDSTAGDVVIEHKLLETEKGWALVDVSINKISLHTAYEPEIQRTLEHGAVNMLEKLRGLVSRN